MSAIFHAGFGPGGREGKSGAGRRRSVWGAVVVRRACSVRLMLSRSGDGGAAAGAQSVRGQHAPIIWPARCLSRRGGACAAADRRGFRVQRASSSARSAWPLPESSAQLYGIDIYLTGNAARGRHPDSARFRWAARSTIRVSRRLLQDKPSRSSTCYSGIVFCLSAAARPSAGSLRLARSTVDDADIRRMLCLPSRRLPR